MIKTSLSRNDIMIEEVICDFFQEEDVHDKVPASFSAMVTCTVLVTGRVTKQNVLSLPNCTKYQVACQGFGANPL